MRLTALTEAFDAAHAKGKPLQLDVASVTEDPNQPRKEFDDATLRELADSIAERGVKTPISVHPDPVWPGKYIVNHGARRLRASRLAGRVTIPAFVDEQYDAYDQVIENLQRENLTPMELAMFIKLRIDAGDKKGDIARQLGKAPAMIAYHLALIDAPAVIDDAYAAGVTSPKTLYELRSLHEKVPEQVEALVASGAAVTRKTIAEIASAPENLVMTKKKDRKQSTANPPENLVMTKKSPPPSVMTVIHNGRRATVASSSTLILVYENTKSGYDDETAEVQLGEVEVVGVVKI